MPASVLYCDNVIAGRSKALTKRMSDSRMQRNGYARRSMTAPRTAATRLGIDLDDPYLLGKKWGGNG
jgi:hypothetical protein